MFRIRFLMGLIGTIAFTGIAAKPAQAGWVNGWYLYPYKYFIHNQISFRPMSNTTYSQTGLSVSDYSITKPPIDAKGIAVGATRNADGSPAWAFRWIAIWHHDISGLWRSGPGIHHDFIQVVGGGNNQNIPTNLLIQDVQLHDGDAIPIMIQDGWFDKIKLKDVRYWNLTSCIQIAMINSGHVDTIEIDHCPNVSIALMGRPGSIVKCYVSNSPGIRIADVANVAGKSGVQIIYVN